MRARTSGFGRAVKTPRSAPSGFGRPHREAFVTRTRKALADSARERAEMARRRLAMKLRGHKHTCPGCGRTARDPERIAVCRARHAREAQARRTAPRGKDKGRAVPSVPVKGRERHECHCGGRACKGTYRNRVEFNDHARLLAEREARAEKRTAERGRRTEAARTREVRGGRPAGKPRARTTRGGRAPDNRPKTERDAEWYAHRMQHAAGRLDREGNRIPHEPSPRVVQPRTRVAPEPR